ncbi:MAG: ankyrin repeat domain-containing protein [Acidobacteria bacterium]|nr:ankyrin repeat domain-containing protein [Acidobacteriota bacterium]
MSDALPLPARPNLEQYKKRAKDLLKAESFLDWAARWLKAIDKEQRPEAHIHYYARQMEKRWQKQAHNLTGAQFFIAREHGFLSWPKFAKHLAELARKQSVTAQFEAAAGAIVSGDIRTLKKLLTEYPKLIKTRSNRDHRSTLLHYVSANGIEDFRQKTPKNIVAITELLLKSGADVNAESDAYGGRSTTLGLAATSCHPEATGVQLELLDLLIANGAIIDGPDSGSAIVGCLHNGRLQAAEFFASRGARLDLEAAAGLGNLKAVKASLKAQQPTEDNLNGAFAQACAYGRFDVVKFLAPKIDMKRKHRGQTWLHDAALGGNVDIIRLLIKRGVPRDVKDDTHDGTPLDWAIYTRKSEEAINALREG